MIGAGELLRSPAWYPLGSAPGGGVDLVRLEEADYREASFLDERLLARPRARMAIEAAPIEEAAAAGVPRAHYLFHIGHVGSTLISRLIGDHAGFFALREPRLLRLLADSRLGAPPLALRTTLTLLSRTWHPGQRAVIKATSLVNDLAPAILDEDPTAAAVLIHVDPLAYLRGIMAGANSRREIEALAPARLARLAGHLAQFDAAANADPVALERTLQPRSEGERVAMSWLCELLALRRTALAHAGRTRWLNFDAFLEDPRGGLAAILGALGTEPSPEALRTLLASPWMHRYSKAPEHAYDARLRREVLAAADHEHGAEIRRGLAWLEAAARYEPIRSLLAPQ